jgi:hypothetical protein
LAKNTRALSPCLVIALDQRIACGLHLADRRERGVDRFQIILLDDLAVFDLFRAAIRHAGELQLEAKAQAKTVLVFLDQVVDGAEHGAVQPYELHPLFGDKRDALAATLAAEFDLANEHPVALAIEHLAMGHGRHEGQRIVRLHDEALPDIASRQDRLARLVDRDALRHFDHGNLPRRDFIFGLLTVTTVTDKIQSLTRGKFCWRLSGFVA